jgi:spore coat protein U-like protein
MRAQIIRAVVMFNSLQPIFSRSKLKLGIVTLLLLPVANLSHASTSASSLSVQVTVMSSAVINSISTALHFGTQGVLTANVDNTFTLNVQCTNTTPYHIGFDVGTGTGATVAVRKMTNGSNTINYSLYTDSMRTTVWGNTVGTDTVAAIGNGAPQSFTVYGRVPAQTTPASGTYTDIITVTVTY